MLDRGSCSNGQYEESNETITWSNISLFWISKKKTLLYFQVEDGAVKPLRQRAAKKNHPSEMTEHPCTDFCKTDIILIQGGSNLIGSSYSLIIFLKPLKSFICEAMQGHGSKNWVGGSPSFTILDYICLVWSVYQPGSTEDIRMSCFNSRLMH